MNYQIKAQHTQERIAKLSHHYDMDSELVIIEAVDAMYADMQAEANDRPATVWQWTRENGKTSYAVCTYKSSDGRYYCSADGGGQMCGPLSYVNNTDNLSTARSWSRREYGYSKLEVVP